MAGFVTGEGCFLVQMSKYGKGKLDAVSLSFKVTRRPGDELLLRSFISFFGCGLFNYHSGKSQTGSGVFIVRKFADISEKILPFFQNHMIGRINSRCLIVDLNIARCKTHLSSVVTVNSLSQQSFYHTFGQNRTTHPISPVFISSYSDEKCSFKVNFKKNNGKFFVRPLFQIKSHSRDNLLLMRIKDYFGGIGNIFTSSNNSKFVVRSLDLIKILTHFDCYPLRTYKKAADFILFKEIVLNIADGEHLSLKGIQKIVNIRASMNSGLSP